MSKSNHSQFTKVSNTKNPCAKVIFNLKSDESELKYTDYEPNEQLNRVNAYWGCVQAFQSGSNAGCTKKYKNVDGLLKIESSSWKDKNIKQTPETRRNPDNWDETRKIFISPEIKLKKVNKLNEDDRLDKYPNGDKIVMIVFNNIRHILQPNQIIEFGNINEPQVKIY